MFIYLTAALIFTSGLFIMLTANNYLKKIFGLAIFQSSVLLFYIALGKIKNGLPPIIIDQNYNYSSPIPHVLMLTAIVVGFATTAVALALIKDIYKNHGSIEENIIGKNADDN